MLSKGQIYWFQEEVWLYVSLWENDPISHLIYYLSELFPYTLTVLIVSFKHPSTEQDGHCVHGSF